MFLPNFRSLSFSSWSDSVTLPDLARLKLNFIIRAYSRLGHETSFLANVNGMQRFLRPNYMSNEKNSDLCEKIASKFRVNQYKIPPPITTPREHFGGLMHFFKIIMLYLI